MRIVRGENGGVVLSLSEDEAKVLATAMEWAAGTCADWAQQERPHLLATFVATSVRAVLEGRVKAVGGVENVTRPR